MASVAICTAVSNPNVSSVAGEVVVDRLGHADDGHAVVERSWAAPGVPSPPIDDEASMPMLGERRLHRSTPPSIL